MSRVTQWSPTGWSFPSYPRYKSSQNIAFQITRTMAKKHIISFGLYNYAFDSVTAATQALALFAKLKPVRYCSDGGGKYAYEPATGDDRPSREPQLQLNQPYRERAEPKPEKAPKPLALPKPKRGTIRCICGFSDVAPRQNCPHCGRPFSESHNRTHSDAKPIRPTLRIVE